VVRVKPRRLLPEIYFCDALARRPAATRPVAFAGGNPEQTTVFETFLKIPGVFQLAIG
jgi:hypothetical protein